MSNPQLGFLLPLLGLAVKTIVLPQLVAAGTQALVGAVMPQPRAAQPRVEMEEMEEEEVEEE